MYQSCVTDKRYFTVQKYELLTEHDGPELTHEATHSIQYQGACAVCGSDLMPPLKIFVHVRDSQNYSIVNSRLWSVHTLLVSSSIAFPHVISIRYVSAHVTQFQYEYAQLRSLIRFLSAQLHTLFSVTDPK